MEFRILGNSFIIFIFFTIITTIFSVQYKIFETSSQIAFSKILRYNITLNDKKAVNNVSSEVLSTSVLSVLVKVQKSEDCIKNSIVSLYNIRAAVHL